MQMLCRFCFLNFRYKFVWRLYTVVRFTQRRIQAWHMYYNEQSHIHQLCL